MKKIVTSLSAMFLLLILVTAVTANDPAVQIKKKEGLGNYLADGKGMALYWFTKDARGQSNCQEGCVENWPIYYTDNPAGSGLNPADFSTITRSDGKKQTAFRGWPLYYFVKDKGAGDTTGQGVKGVWYVVDPANFPPK